MFKKIKEAIESIDFCVGIIPNAYARAEDFYLKSQIRSLQETLSLNKMGEESPMAQVYIVMNDDTINVSSSLMDGIRITVDDAEYRVQSKAVRIPVDCIPFNGAQSLKLPVYIRDEDGVEVSMNLSISVRMTAHKCLGDSQKDVHARLMAQFENARRA